MEDLGLDGIPPWQLAFPKVNNVTVQATNYTLDSWIEIARFQQLVAFFQKLNRYVMLIEFDLGWIIKDEPII